MNEIRETARALRSHAQRVVQAHAPDPPLLAIVRNRDPIAIEVVLHDITLGEDDLVFTQETLLYERDYGLVEGDSVVVVPLGTGDYALVGVISETNINAATPGGGVGVRSIADEDHVQVQGDVTFSGSGLVDIFRSGHNFDFHVTNPIPPGGSTGHVLTKASASDFDMIWQAGSGLSFDTAPQIGDWLSIRTTGTAPPSVAYTNGMSVGIWAHDPGDGSYPGGIDLLADVPFNTPNEIAIGAMNSYGVGISITSHEGFELLNRLSGHLGITNDVGSVTIEADDSVNINADTLDVSLYAQRYANIFGHSAIGMDSDGSIGINAPLVNVGAGAIVYDRSGDSSVDITAGTVVADSEWTKILGHATETSGPLDERYGINLITDAPFGSAGGGIMLQSQDANGIMLRIRDPGHGPIDLIDEVGGGIYMETMLHGGYLLRSRGGGGIYVDEFDGGGIGITSNGAGGMFLENFGGAAGQPMSITSNVWDAGTDHVIEIGIGTVGKKVAFVDHLGHAVLVIDENGNLHRKIGSTESFDL